MYTENLTFNLSGACTGSEGFGLCGLELGSKDLGLGSKVKFGSRDWASRFRAKAVIYELRRLVPRRGLPNKNQA